MASPERGYSRSKVLGTTVIVKESVGRHPVPVTSSDAKMVMTDYDEDDGKWL
jgi:hypothetical protein